MKDIISEPGVRRKKSVFFFRVAVTIFDLLVILLIMRYAYPPLFQNGRGLKIDDEMDDTHLQNMPMLIYTGRALRDGRIPLWSPTGNLGAPYLALPYAGVFYLPNAIYGGEMPFYDVYRTDTLVHLLLMVFVGYVLGRRLTGSRFAGLFLALSLILSGIAFESILNSTFFPFAIHLDGWMPLVLLALLELLRSRRPIFPMVAFALVTGVAFLAGDQQRFIYLFISMGLITGFELIRRLVFQAKPVLKVAGTGVATLAGVVLGFLLVSAQALPSLELLGESIRSGGLADSVSDSIFLTFTPHNILDGLVRNEGSFSIPPLVLISAVGALVSYRRTVAWPLFWAGALVVTFALGYNGPLSPAMNDIPILGSMRLQVRALIYAEFFVFILAAMGLRRLVSRDLSLEIVKRYWAFVLAGLLTLLLLQSSMSSLIPFLGMATLGISIGYFSNRIFHLDKPGTLVASVVIWTLPWTVKWFMLGMFEIPDGWLFFLRTFTIGMLLRSVMVEKKFSHSLPALVTLTAIMLGYSMTEHWTWPNQYEQLAVFAVPIALYLLLLKKWPEASIGAPALVCVLFGIFVFIEVNISSSIKTSSPSDYAEDPDYLKFLTTRRDNDRVALLNHIESLSLNQITGDTQQLTGLPYGARLLTGYGPIPLSRYARFCNAFIDPETVVWNADGELASVYTSGSEASDWVNKENAFVLDLLNIRWIVATSRPPAYIASQVHTGRFIDRSSEFGKLFVYENTTALPHAYLVHETLISDTDEQLFAAIRESGKRRNAIAFLLADEAPSFKSTSNGSEGTTVIESYAPEQVVIRTESSEPSILILTDAWYPGWEYRVDNGPWQKAFPVNYVLRGATVPAGSHTIEFAFRSASFRIGVYLSVGAVLILLILTTTEWVLRRRLKKSDTARLANKNI